MAEDVWRDSEPPRRSRYDWPEITRNLRRRLRQVAAHRRTGPAQPAWCGDGGRIAYLRDDPRRAYEIRTRNTHGTLADIWMMARKRGRDDGSG